MRIPKLLPTLAESLGVKLDFLYLIGPDHHPDLYKLIPELVPMLLVANGALELTREHYALEKRRREHEFLCQKQQDMIGVLQQLFSRASETYPTLTEAENKAAKSNESEILSLNLDGLDKLRDMYIKILNASDVTQQRKEPFNEKLAALETLIEYKEAIQNKDELETPTSDKLQWGINLAKIGGGLAFLSSSVPYTHLLGISIYTIEAMHTFIQSVRKTHIVRSQYESFCTRHRIDPQSTWELQYKKNNHSSSLTPVAQDKLRQYQLAVVKQSRATLYEGIDCVVKAALTAAFIASCPGGAKLGTMLTALLWTFIGAHALKFIGNLFAPKVKTHSQNAVQRREDIKNLHATFFSLSSTSTSEEGPAHNPDAPAHPSSEERSDAMIAPTA